MENFLIYLGDIAVIIETYEWLICWLIRSTLHLIKELECREDDKVKIKSLYQVFKGRTLALVYGEFMVLSYFLRKCQHSENPALRSILFRLFYLYGIWSLYRHIPVLYEGNFCKNGSLSQFISDAILYLCSELKPEAVSLVEAIAPPDFILNSVLGCSDGRVYERLLDSFQPPEIDSSNQKGLVKSKL